MNYSILKNQNIESENKYERRIYNSRNPVLEVLNLEKYRKLYIQKGN